MEYNGAIIQDLLDIVPSDSSYYVKEKLKQKRRRQQRIANEEKSKTKETKFKEVF
jgi:hypothetical protein